MARNINSRGEWWNRGFFVPRRDNERGHNEGLSKREIEALEEENFWPFGRRSIPSSKIAKRGKQAKRGSAEYKAYQKSRHWWS